MVEAEVFHMLVERLGNIEDTLGRMEKQLYEDRQPYRFADLKPEHFEKKAWRERAAIKFMFRRPVGSVGTWLTYGFSQSQIETLKRNGFSLFADKKDMSGGGHYFVAWGSFTVEQFHDKDIYQL